MGIMKKLSAGTQLNSNYESCQFYIGEAEAEAEANVNAKIGLIDFFSDYLGIFDKLDQQHFLIIGRKGSGKTAIAEYIMKHSENTPTLSCCFIRHSDIDLYRAITNIESINISSYAFFEWIILINIVDNIICHNEIFNYKNISDLKKFYEVNSGMVSIMARETTNAIDEQSFTVKLEYLKRFFTSSLNKKLSISSERAPFFKVIKELKEFVISCMHCKHNIENENYFYIMIDDLDVNFDANNINHVKGIAELIRAAKEYNNLLADCFFKVIIFIRDDILNAIDSCSADMNKIITSYGVKINWYDYNTFNNDIDSLPLKKMIDNRIKINFDKMGKRYTKIWYDFINDKNYAFFKNIIDITFARPRDMICFFATVSDMKTNFPLTQKEKTKLEKNYCNTIVSELKNELSNFYHFEQVDSIFQSLRILIREKENGFKLDTLYTALSRTNIQIDPKKTAEFLFDRSIIGLYLENNDMPFLRFKYREDRMSPIQIYDSDRLTLHKSIYKYFTTHN